jgi:hypothetical protein
MSFVTEQMMSSIEELLDSLKAASDRSGLEAMPPVVVFKENKEDAKANVTMFDDKEEDDFEEALVRTFYKVHTHGVEKAHWIGVAMESYGVLKDGVLVEQSADLEPETLEKDFKENPFSEVTEAFTVFLASEDNESEFLFYPYTRDDHGKPVRGKPFIRSIETNDGISHIEAMLLRFQELMRMLRNGEVNLDDED